MDDLARWLKASDSLGAIFDDETDTLEQDWRQSREELNRAIREAASRQVAEDEIGFLEAIEPVQAALAEHVTSLRRWESFLDTIKPRTEPRS